MTHNRKLKILMVIALSLTTLPNYAATDPGVSKDVWLTNFKAIAPAVMCQKLMESHDARSVLDANHIGFDKCIPMITQSMNSCLDKSVSAMPATFDVDQGKKWGLTIGKCAGADFYAKNIVQKQ